MTFLYSALLKLLYPTSIALLLLALGLVFRRKPRTRRSCNVLAVLVLLVCGNGGVAAGLIRRLEGQYPTPDPMPTADAILILSGGSSVARHHAQRSK